MGPEPAPCLVSNDGLLATLAAAGVVRAAGIGTGTASGTKPRISSDMHGHGTNLEWENLDKQDVLIKLGVLDSMLEEIPSNKKGVVRAPSFSRI